MVAGIPCHDLSSVRSKSYGTHAIRDGISLSQMQLRRWSESSP
ncbi:MAG: hypothetical protein ACRCYZ_01760 [Alphaproteobacteria bacterium]